MARVLVVDDSKETCEFLEELLGKIGRASCRERVFRSV